MVSLTPTPASEDCLFLDVITPRSSFQSTFSTKLPVMVLIHGGGYVAGDKNAADLQGNNPVGLLKRSREDVVFVTFNYRVSCCFVAPTAASTLTNTLTH